MFEKIKDFFFNKYIESQGLKSKHFYILNLISKSFILKLMPNILEKIKLKDKITEGFFIGTLFYFYQITEIQKNLDKKKLKPENLANLIHEVFAKDWNISNKEAYNIYVDCLKTYDLYKKKELTEKDEKNFNIGLQMAKIQETNILRMINQYTQIRPKLKLP